MEKKNVLDQEFLDLLRTMVLKFNLSLKDGNLGGNRSKAKGSSVEFSDFREYIPGDDFRRIDWRALARFEKVYIKLFMEEREAPITIFVDKSKSMDFGLKRETAIKMAATFAFSALKEYDSVSTIMFDQKASSFEINQKGQPAFSKIMNLLENTTFSQDSDLYSVLNSWQPRFKKGLTVLITDLMFDAHLEETMKLLTFKKQKIILCHVLSQEELYPELEGNLRLIDSETDEHMDILTGTDAVNLYAQTLSHYINTTKEVCSKYKADYLLLNSSKPVEQLLKQLHVKTS
ncbi:MAG: hypothetical protein CVU84_15430 [Firmicutes bacterium HGW-Firmicutes-1]|jgi:uncharacterized protein (DUF58 family)|nr:MAG: hypothetical protein CVU84_15430 [Firmicutes bacterium HGW-Firmicutes-1]